MLAALRRATLIAAFVAPACSARIASLVQQEVSPRAVDGIGLASDAAVALLLLLVAAVVRRQATQVLALILIVLFTLACYANYEHIRALNTSLDLFSLKFLGDETFVRGTLHVSSPWLLLPMLALALALLAVSQPLPRSWRTLLPLLAAAGIAAIVTSALPPRNDIATWRQFNFVHQNMLGITHRAFAKRGADSVLAKTEHRYQAPRGLTEEEQITVDRLLRLDLTGTARFPRRAEQTNVLLIVLEAVSGAYLDVTAAPHNKSVHYDMPRLSARAGRALVYRNFVSHQRRTNRGEYSLLCGDHPNLALKQSKMDYYALEPDARRRCLPASLHDAGFHTVYLQAAPLGFMFKDQFMQRAGFDEVLGMAWFETSTAWSAWGPDDRSFLTQSLREVDELRAQPRPWMLTLLTSGTHHPYHTAADFRGQHRAGSLAHAIEFLDLAIDEFLEELRTRGVLEDTLVLITSDEAEGVRQGDDLVRIMSQNWSPMLVFAPGVAAATVDERFGQSDLALSVLDYLGLATDQEGYLGRSMFRSYSQPRPTVFGNVYRDRVGMIRADGLLLLCDSLLQDCQSYSPASPELVPAAAAAQRAAETDRRVLQQFLARNELGQSPPSRGHVELARPGETVLRSQNTRYAVFGYQYLTIPANTDLAVEILLSVSQGSVTFLGDLASDAGGKRRFTSQHRAVSAGEVLRIAFTYNTSERLERTEVRLFAENTGQSTAVFELLQAGLELSPAQRGISGIVEQRVEVRR